MQIKSNALVKFIVPAVVIAGLAVGLKSCKNEPAEQPQAKQSGSLKNLSPDELKALGVEGDTPEDTLRTLIGRLAQWPAFTGYRQVLPAAQCPGVCRFVAQPENPAPALLPAYDITGAGRW